MSPITQLHFDGSKPVREIVYPKERVRVGAVVPFASLECAGGDGRGGGLAARVLFRGRPALTAERASVGRGTQARDGEWLRQKPRVALNFPFP